MAKSPNKSKTPGARLQAPERPESPDRMSNSRPATLQMETAKGGKLPNLLQVTRNAIDAYETFTSGALRKAWERSYQAYRNSHFADSKYKKKGFEARSKVFRPKTRAAVRKGMTAAAMAMFSTEDVISVSAEREGDREQRAGAAILDKLLNYRLDRTSNHGGIDWFATAMGARQDSMITGIVVSKQHWEFEERDTGEVRLVQEPAMQPVVDPATGMPAMDPATGQPAMQPVVDPMTGQPAMQPVLDELGQPVLEPIMEVVKDRPAVTLVPGENVVVDMGADWRNPIQSSPYVIVRYPMTVGEIKSWIRMSQGQGVNALANPKHVHRFLPVDDAVLLKATEDYEAASVRQARTGREDPQDNVNRTSTKDFQICWVHENFVRWDGCDYHFWSVDTHTYLSEVRETREVYPDQMGERPYVYGFGQIEAHSVVPMSDVESWSQLQQEANDITNLRLDAMKQGIAPIAKVKEGTMFDFTQLNNRGAGGQTFIVRDPKDLEFDRAPGPAGEAYLETDRLNVDFDELAGQFATSSVQSNRQLNETVGGMRIMQGQSNAVTEYDLRVFTETWTERVLRQLLNLERYYETNEIVLAIAGEKAELMEKFGINEVTDTLLRADTRTRVNVGIGATDPQQQLGKLAQAVDLIGKAAPSFDVPVRTNAEEFIEEVFGKSGYKDGLRFVTFLDPAQMGGQDPEMMKAQAEIAMGEKRLQMESEHAAKKLALDERRYADERQRTQQKDAAEHAHKQLTFRQGLAKQNREVMAEQESEAALAATAPAGAPAPTPQASPIEQMMQAVAQLTAVIAQSQTREAQAEIRQAAMLGRQADMLDRLAMALTADRQIVFDSTGNPVGMRIERPQSTQ